MWNNIVINKEGKNYLKILFKGETIPVFWNNIRGEHYQSLLINPIKPQIVTVGHQYVACVYDHLNDQIDQLVKRENSRQKSLV